MVGLEILHLNKNLQPKCDRLYSLQQNNIFSRYQSRSRTLHQTSGTVVVPHHGLLFSQVTDKFSKVRIQAFNDIDDGVVCRVSTRGQNSNFLSSKRSSLLDLLSASKAFVTSGRNAQMPKTFTNSYTAVAIRNVINSMLSIQSCEP